MAEAYQRWAGAQAGRKNAYRVISEHGSPEALIREIAVEIQTRTLALRPIRHYTRVEPTNGKRRLIGVHSVKQQVVDYVAICVMEPFLTAKAGFYQVSSTKGKGQLFAARAVRKWSLDGGYWVHVDVRQCYPSISGDLVLAILRRYIRSPDVLYVARVILSTYGSGLDIGSYFSLRMAQLVLSFGYHHMESLAKVRRGKRIPLVAHQLWYMDDVILIGPDKRNLRSATRSLERYLGAELGLALKPWKICQVGNEEPIDIAGYVIRPGRTTIRASIFLRLRRAHLSFHKRPSLKLARRICAYWGWLAHADCARYISVGHIIEAQARARLVIAQSPCCIQEA